MRYTQKDICKAFDIKRDTLRHYEQLGILAPEIGEENGYRYYDDWQINLLWEVKRYQSMGFSLTEIKQMLQEDSLSTFNERMSQKLDDLGAELRYNTLRLECLLHYEHMLQGIEEHLGAYRIEQTPTIRFIARREVHDLIFDEDLQEAGSFANTHHALSIPCAYFPDILQEQYYWGFAFRASCYEELGGPHTGSLLFEGGRALVTCVDAGERWNFGNRLFEAMVSEARTRGETPAGPLYGHLLSRVHDQNRSFHRYIEAVLPLC